MMFPKQKKFQFICMVTAVAILLFISPVLLLFSGWWLVGTHPSIAIAGALIMLAVAVVILSISLTLKYIK